MKTQQDIIDSVTSLGLRYQITWQVIKRHADKAVSKINDYLGTKYPNMSEVLDGPQSVYGFSSEGTLIPYIKDEYIENIIVPFIGSEVLAHDEEFTFTYQKYQADVADGLFSMFQKEFNRVPLAFRQDPDAGVFFASDSAKGRKRHNADKDLPIFKFRVHYHINNAQINTGEIPFIQDTRGYLYEDTAIIKGWHRKYLSVDGVWAYTFKGWARSEHNTPDEVVIGSEIKMVSDVHFYALWDKDCTLSCRAGVVTIKDEYKYSLTNLVIPNIVNNMMVRTIPTDFLVSDPSNDYYDAVRINRIELPEYITYLEEGCFNGYQGEYIIFPETEIDNETYSGIRIGRHAFNMCPNLASILIPANVRTILENAFPAVDNLTRTITMRILEQNKPQYFGGIWTEDDGEIPDPSFVSEMIPGSDYGWHADWAQGNTVTYQVTKVWGYNG